MLLSVITEGVETRRTRTRIASSTETLSDVIVAGDHQNRYYKSVIAADYNTNVIVEGDHQNKYYKSVISTDCNTKIIAAQNLRQKRKKSVPPTDSNKSVYQQSTGTDI